MMELSKRFRYGNRKQVDGLILKLSTTLNIHYDRRGNIS